jgi:hypothetical protein
VTCIKQNKRTTSHRMDARRILADRLDKRDCSLTCEGLPRLSEPFLYAATEVFLI